MPEFLIEQDDEIRLAGSRIGLAHLVRSYRRGESAEMIALRFPTLTLAQVHKALAYYLENQAGIDAHLQQVDAGLERQRSSAPAPSVAELQARLTSNPPLARGA